MLPWVNAWAQALQDTHVVPDLVHSDAAFAEYLRWYLPWTRMRVTYTPPEVVQRTPALTDMYPVQHEQAVAYRVSYFIIQTRTLMITYT